MKQLDKYIIIAIFLMSAIWMVSFEKQSSMAKSEEAKVVISIMGDVIYEIPLDGSSHEYKLASELGYNEIIINEQGVKVSVSDCVDHFCETVGVINKVGQSIICAPHLLVVEIIV